MSLGAIVSTKVTWKNKVKQEIYPMVLEDQKPLVHLVHSVDLTGKVTDERVLVKRIFQRHEERMTRKLICRAYLKEAPILYPKARQNQTKRPRHDTGDM